MTVPREGRAAREGDGAQGVDHAGWHIIAPVEDTLTPLDDLMDRLTHSGKWIKARRTVDLEDCR